MHEILDLKNNDKNIQKISNYGRNDVLFALIMYIVMLLEAVLLGKIAKNNLDDLTEMKLFMLYGLITLAIFAILYILLTIRKQNLATIGFNIEQAKKSFGAGLLLVLIVVILRGVIPVISGKNIITNIPLITMKIVHYLIFIALTEEVVFRGYIGTRFYGYFKKKRLSIIIVGVIWYLGHIPFKSMVAQLSMLEYILAYGLEMPSFILFHCYLQYLYLKYNSIIAPTMLHFIWNFMNWLIID